MGHERAEADESLKDAPRWILWLMAFINRTGFPIVVCIFLAWFLLFKMDEYKTESARTAQTIVDAVKGNTTALGLLTDAVKGINRRRND